MSGVFAFVVAVMTGLLGFWLGAHWMMGVLHDDAIKAGAGRWTVNSETGETDFVFLNVKDRCDGQVSQKTNSDRSDPV